LTLAALSLETPLTLHPAAQLVTSVWPIGTIWAAHQGDPAPVTAKGAEAVLICRPALTVGVHVLPPADLPFVAALFHGAPLEEAAEQAMTNPDFDFGRALTGLVRLGAFGETR
jgi:energy-converting hydrogenase Eha subunit A